ncbi:glycoside hydrolase family 28 protein [Pelagibacterium limicola]|uniref:polygalacturonase PglB n=1 Tax=Pelagibacterium limicola TaxID=2791022 RepID=UPI0018AFA2B6|nr:glycoside hydrolase family 28 protein [Pelagibacterium limicola]
MTQAGNEIALQGGGADATARIQDAIDTLSAAGGGRAVLSAGVYRCRGLRLKSGVTLHIDEGAVLRPVPDYAAYQETRVRIMAEDSDRAMILAEGAHDIGISGKGLIAAGGAAFIAGNDDAMGTWIPSAMRPRVIVLDRCTKVRLEDFTVRESPMWTIHAICCSDVVARGIRVFNDLRMPNTDGFVVDACRNVAIEGVELRTADDGVVLKTTALPDGKPSGDCRHVRVADSVIESRSCALKIGTETHGDFNDIVFEDCRIENSNRGLGIFSRDGGKISNVRFSRIAVDCRETPDGFWGSGEALTINVVDRKPHQTAGEITNVLVEDITGTTEGAINMVAPQKGRINQVRLSRIALTQQPGRIGTALRYDLRPGPADLVPPPLGSGRANAWVKDASGAVVGLVPYPDGMPGLYAQNVEDLDLDRVAITRPSPIPEGWNGAEAVVSHATAESMDRGTPQFARAPRAR